MDTKRMPLMILDFNGFMGIVYAAEAENIICKDTKEMASKTGESCLLQVLPYFDAKVKMAERGIRQGTSQQIVH